MVVEVDALTRLLERDRSIGAVVITGGHPQPLRSHCNVAEILAGAEATPDATAAVLLDRLAFAAELLPHRQDGTSGSFT